MPSQGRLLVTIVFTDSDEEKREAEALKLEPLLKARDEVQTFERVLISAPNGGMGTVYLPGWLATEINADKGMEFLSFLENELAGKPIELKIASRDKNLEGKASNPEELRSVIAQAEQFMIPYCLHE